MNDQSKGYSSQEDDEDLNNEEEEEENDEELNDDKNNNNDNNNNDINNNNENNNNKIIDEKNNINDNKIEKEKISDKKSEKNTETKINNINNINDTIMKETEKDKIIIELKKELQEKDLKIKILTKTNNKLRQSLENFSKQIDMKINSKKNDKNFFDKLSNLKNKKFILKPNLNNKIKEKELNNAVNMIKILRNDNRRLQAFVDNYEKDNHLHELENLNKEKIYENSNLEKQIKDLKEQLSDYNNYVKKNKDLEKQIEMLSKDNKLLKENIKSLNNQLFIKNQKNESRSTSREIFSTKRRKISLIKLEKTINTQNSIFNTFRININPINKNKKNNSISINQNQNTSLPSIRSPKNHSPIKKDNSLNKIISLKKNYTKNIDNILPQFFTEEEIDLINNKLFRNNTQGLETFKIKLCILNKSKETLDNKYKNEIKQYKERLTSTQEQIDYLNSKIRELEIKCQILQTQKNEDIIRKKLLQKKVQNLEKNLQEKEDILQLYMVKNVDINKNNNNENKNEDNKNKENDSFSSDNLDNDNNQSKKEESTEKSQEDENSWSKEDSKN